MALADIWRSIAVHGLAGGVGVALWFASRTDGGPRSDKEPVTAAGARERSVEVQRRGRDLADEAVEAHGETAVHPSWIPRSSRQMAEAALARREETIAERQSDAVALVAAAGKFAGDERLLEKIEEFLFTGGNEEKAAAMMLALVLRDEEGALEEIRSREALLDEFTGLGVLDGLQAAALERWAAREDLPMRLRMSALSNLAQRLGPASDLEGLARVWQQQAGDPELREDFIDAFVRQWLCGDGPEAVGMIFDKWPEELRVAFLEKLDGFRDGARPIWTDTLSTAMWEAPLDSVPEAVADMIRGEIKRADEPPDLMPDLAGSSAPLLPGLNGEEARRKIDWGIDVLLGQGPDLREQLADGRIDVDGLARRIASRLPGSQLYPAEFAEVIFEVSAGIDPVGALRYSRGKIAPHQLESLGSEVLQQVEENGWRLDRMLATAALLPASQKGRENEAPPGSVDLVGDFADWHSLAPEPAGEALNALPAKHPLRKSIEARIGKEGNQ